MENVTLVHQLQLHMGWSHFEMLDKQLLGETCSDEKVAVALCD